MKYLSYKNNSNKNQLFVENVSIQDIAKEVGTPFYCYSKKAIIENYQVFAESFANFDHKICYAIKANCNFHIVKILAELGSGIDAVSAGEVFRAVKAGIDPKKIVFAGVGKTKEEIAFALSSGVEEFSAESEAEIFALNEVAQKLNKKIKLSLRVNPNVDAKTHDKISTGRKGDKFGIDIDKAEEIYEKAKKLPALEIYGISTHIGSQITSIEPFKKAFEKVRELCLSLRKKGFDIKSLDLGGGIGILYKNENTLLIQDYAAMIKEIIGDLNVKLTIAPGRAMIGNAGIMVTKVIYLKETDHKNFVIIDAAMNDLMRPGLYDSYHEVLQESIKHGVKLSYDLVGPICESTDVLAKNRDFITPKSEDLLVFCSAGAYGSSMSNEYNCRPMIPEVLVENNKFTIIRRRPTFEEMLHLEV
ncbi:MAG: diaminopimelate decarboxylase [Pelagibacterales bacterium]|nr:diaminopimelate decarboxylase [Pelagibacterales bacterium]